MGSHAAHVLAAEYAARITGIVERDVVLFREDGIDIAALRAHLAQGGALAGFDGAAVRPVTHLIPLGAFEAGFHDPARLAGARATAAYVFMRSGRTGSAREGRASDRPHQPQRVVDRGMGVARRDGVADAEQGEPALGPAG